MSTQLILNSKHSGTSTTQSDPRSTQRWATRSVSLAETIDADPSVIAAYEVARSDTVGNILVTTLLAGALFTLVLPWPPAPIATDE